MRILMDVDGVLADFVGGVISLLNGRMIREDIKEWQFIEALPERDKLLVKAYMKNPGFWQLLPVIDGAKAGIAKLREKHEVIFVTSPWVSCKEWEFRRRRWLKRHFKAENRDIVFTHNKALVKGDLIIDDRPKNLQEWLKANAVRGHGLLYAQSYNEKFPYVRFTWDDIPEVLL